MALSRDHKLGLFLVFTSTLAWSTAGLFTRAISQDIFTVLVWRGLFGTAGLLAVIVWRDGAKGLRTLLWLGGAGWAYALISGLGMVCYILALRMTSVAHVVVIYATVPFMTAGLAWLMMRQRPSRDAVIACSIAFAGAVVMVGLGGDGNLGGDLLALLMTLSMALMMVIARKHPKIPTLPAGTASSILGVLICLPSPPPVCLRATNYCYWQDLVWSIRRWDLRCFSSARPRFRRLKQHSWARWRHRWPHFGSG